MHRVNDDKFGPLEAHDSKEMSDESPAWLALVIIALLFGLASLFAFTRWHDHISGPEFRTAEQVSTYDTTFFACAAETSTKAARDQCMKDSGLGAPSYPWPAAHVGLSAVIVFFAVLIVGRLYIFMRRIESRP